MGRGGSKGAPLSASLSTSIGTVVSVTRAECGEEAGAHLYHGALGTSGLVLTQVTTEVLRLRPGGQ